MQIKYYAYYRDFTGCKQEELPAPATVGELLTLLSSSYGPAVREKLLSSSGVALGPDAIVLVNGRNIEHLAGLNTPLSDHDTVSIFPIVAGG